MAAGKRILLIILVILVLSSVQGAGASPVLVTKCGVLSAPGQYYLINDITDSPKTTCIEITASNVLFDGNGHTIDGTDNASSFGIWVHGASPLTSVVVSDVKVTQWNTGIYALFARNTSIQDVRSEDNNYGISLSETNDTRIEGNQIRNNHVEEIYLWFSSNNTIRNNHIESPLVPGSLAFLVTNSHKNRIYNNYINNSRGIIARFANTWNTTKTSGINIVNGPALGGNYWATPAGNGYSETCTDADGDGFCDAPLVLNANNTDQLPLSDPYRVTGCRRITAPGTYHLENDILDSAASICIEILGSDVLFDGAGHRIEGNGTAMTYGIVISNLAPYEPRRVGVADVTLRNWGSGLFWHNGIGGNLTRTQLSDNLRNGLYVLESRNISIDHISVRGNGEAGVGLISVQNSSLVKSHLFNNNKGSHLDYGMVMTDTTTSLIADNNVSENGHVGIYLYSSRDNTLRNNTVNANGNYGFIVTKTVSYPVSSGNVLAANTVTMNGQTGISIRAESTQNTVTGNLVRNNLINGIEITGSSTENTVQGNIITSNSGSGIAIESSGANLIADNYFNNTINFQNWSIFGNTWNTTKMTGPNIIGGPYRGGNYWARPDGLGFSETCTDPDGDGICNAPYPLFSQNTDYLPLKEKGTLNSCMVIAQPGTYEVEDDILNSNAASCIRITASDVIVDGNGHTVDGIGTTSSRGVHVSHDTKTLSNVTVRDLVLTNWGQGIFFDRTGKNRIEANTLVKNYQGIEVDRTTNSSIAKNTVSDNTGHGILLHLSCNNNSIVGNTVENNDYSGIYLHEHSSDNEVIGNIADDNQENGIFVQVVSNRNVIRRNLVRQNTGSGVYVWGSSDNIIADNSFNNSVNVRLRDVTANTWNTSRHSAKNILGSPVSGGNSWAQPDRLGFSDTCADANNDGICDNENSFDSTDTDRLPLVAFTLLPLPGYTVLPTDPDHDGIYEDLNGNGRLDFADVVLYFNQMTWIAENEPVFLFDLNHNGRIDFADIVALFNEI